MQRTPVQSRHLAAFGYDALRRTLEVEFANGSVYEYQDVPRELADGLAAADSKGAFFVENVRRAFQGRRIED